MTRTAREDLELVDWRRRIGDLYRLGGPDALERFRRGRDELFRTHPQSPVPEESRAPFGGIPYFEPDAAMRFSCQVQAADGSELVIETGGDDGDVVYRRALSLGFTVHGRACRLTVFAMRGYGGGLFCPFRDATSGTETYGGGRYLFDTVKNTDGLALEVDLARGMVEIDFNYAYNPSCAFDHRWACPLAPRENWLPVPIRAGEMTPAG